MALNNNNALLRALAVLCREEKMQATVKGSAMGGVLAGAGAACGGLLLGPVGLAVGGTVGSIIAYKKAKGTFKPVAEIIFEMTPAQQDELVENLRLAVAQISITDLAILIPMLTSEAAVRDIAIRTVTGYMRNNMGVAIN